MRRLIDSIPETWRNLIVVWLVAQAGLLIWEWIIEFSDRKVDDAIIGGMISLALSFPSNFLTAPLVAAVPDFSGTLGQVLEVLLAWSVSFAGGLAQLLLVGVIVGRVAGRRTPAAVSFASPQRAIPNSWRRLIVAWLLVQAGLVACWFLAKLAGVREGDLQGIVMTLLLALSFPSWVLFFGAASGVSAMTGYGSGELGIVPFWAMTFAAGLAQLLLIAFIAGRLKRAGRGDFR